ncbi:hypothetical protein L5515_013591 [Caenorhabditis briggsae]|uniref:Uncharacterized protein n=1 Tax=Caenorhabditis briggsae TaxID=6238 RepID=A0AAE9J783_CAEBR|nr:hypothetical protein L5515_013591 [Caenorhabditis briggsae]
MKSRPDIRMPTARQRTDHSQTLAAKDSRTLLQINDDVRMFVDSGIEDPFKKMTGEMDEIERDLVAAHRKLDRFSEAFDCNCTNGCTATSPWKLWTKPSTRKAIHDPESIRHYGCSQFCKCKGQCKKAFPKPPVETPKGFALVAKKHKFLIFVKK